MRPILAPSAAPARGAALVLVLAAVLVAALALGRWRATQRAGPAQAAAVLELSRRPELRLVEAGADELAALPGLGPVLARRIVAHRDRTGAREVEDLSAIPGLGRNRLALLRRHLAGDAR